ncbi:MAG: 50S ribosomal protein L25 [Vicinamibacterales bacterium]
MAERHTIQANIRTITGKETKKLRRVGDLPGVVYGPMVSDPISVTVDMKELDRMYYAYGSNLLVDLTVDGSTFPVYLRRVTIDRVVRQPLHVEFYAPNMQIAMNASVPVLIVGEPENDAGVLTIARESIDVRGLPDSLPPSFEVDVTGLAEFDQAIYVRDLAAPENVEVITDGDEMVVKLSAPTIIREEEPVVVDELAAEDVEAAGAAEGVDVEASAGDEAEREG